METKLEFNTSYIDIYKTFRTSISPHLIKKSNDIFKCNDATTMRTRLTDEEILLLYTNSKLNNKHEFENLFKILQTYIEADKLNWIDVKLNKISNENEYIKKILLIMLIQDITLY